MRSSFRQEFSSKHNLMNAMSCDPYQVNYYAVVHASILSCWQAPPQHLANLLPELATTMS